MTSPTGASLGVSGEPGAMRQSGKVLADGAANLDKLRNTQMASGMDVHAALMGQFYGALSVTQDAADVAWKRAVQKVITLGEGMVLTAGEMESQDELAKGGVARAGNSAESAPLGIPTMINHPTSSSTAT